MTSEPTKSSAGDVPGTGGYLALVLAWAVPGLGHVMLGERARGIIFGVTIHGLFALGLLVAGIRAINPPEQAIWTYTQYLAGWPMVFASHVEKTKLKEAEKLQLDYLQERPPPDDDSKIAERKAYGKKWMDEYPIVTYHPKIQDIGAVYCGIAGMLNLLVIFDVLLRVTGSQRDTSPRKKRGGAKDVGMGKGVAEAGAATGEAR